MGSLTFFGVDCLLGVDLTGVFLGALALYFLGVVFFGGFVIAFLGILFYCKVFFPGANFFAIFACVFRFDFPIEKLFVFKW